MYKWGNKDQIICEKEIEMCW